jgi:hypothetical protein
MKKFFESTEEKRNFNGFDVLTSNEMLQVRGGSDVKPDTRDKDIFDFGEE